MRHCLLLFALLLLRAGCAPAQTSTPIDGGSDVQLPEYRSTAFADSINRVFQYLDKSRVPSGILEEYGLQFISHAPYTGTSGYSAANQVDIHRWRALYGDLYGARINANARTMPSLAAVNARLQAYATDAYVELPLLHFTYHSVRTNALSAGRIRSVNNRLYDVAGQDPYEAQSAFAVAAVAAALPSPSPAFVFRPNLFFTNTGRTVAALRVDFADGSGFVAMSWNSPRTVSYASAGPRDVRVQVQYTDGSTFAGHFRVLVPELVAQPRYAGTPDLDLSIAATKSLNGDGLLATARVTVEYGGRNKPVPDPAVLDKPLIVVKGFDLSGFFGGPGTRATYYSFITNKLGKVINEALSDGADLDGYDLVYVDFDYGVDYLQRSAYVLEEVIKWVNGHKTGTAPNAVLTMSMGGLETQYALADIETDLRNGVSGVTPHQVGLLITLDAPYQGANVPLSLQLLVRQLAMTTVGIPFGGSIKLTDRLPELGVARDALLSPAARQLLRYQTTVSGVFGFNIATAAATSDYDAFQQEYRALLAPTGGQPGGTPGRPLRIVAVANGSECGRPQPYGPYAPLVQVDRVDNAANLGLFDVLHVPILATSALGTLGALGVISGPAAIVAVAVTTMFALGLTGNYDLTTLLTLRALPDQQNSPICDVFAQVEKRTRLFGLFRVQVTLLEYHASSLASMLPLDSGSGGIISVSEYAALLGSAGTTLPAAIKQTQFCFSPTYSTLDITPGSSSALTAQYSPGISPGSPFANFRTAARQNEGHVEFTAVNTAWMLKELRGLTPVVSCASFCAAEPSITGPNFVCAGGATFTLNGLSAGTTVEWQLDTSAPVSASTGTGTTFSPSFTGTDAGGHALLTATLTSTDCGQLLYTKKVYVGLAERAELSGPANPACGTHDEYYTITNYDPLLTYNVTTTGAFHGSKPIRAGGVVQVLVAGSGPASLTVAVSNPCGPAVSDVTFQANVDACTNYTVHPNPAYEQTTVSQETTSGRPATQRGADPATGSNATGNGPAFTVRVYDTYGTLWHTATAASPQLQLGTSPLPAGLYVLTITEAGSDTVVRRQLQVRRP